MQVQRWQSSRQRVYWSSWTTDAAQVCAKLLTTNASAFQTPTHGPLGLVMRNRNPLLQNSRATSSLDLDCIQSLVPIISAYAGMTDRASDMLDWMAWVIQAFGVLMFPEAAQVGENLLQKVPVALVSRCFNGIAEPVYAWVEVEVAAWAGVFFVKRTQQRSNTPQIINCLHNAGLKGQALRRLYGRINLFSRNIKIRESSQFPIFTIYGYFRVEATFVRAMRQTTRSSNSSLCIILVNIRMR